MEAIDRKFKFTAISLRSKKKYTQNNAVVFLAKDALLPDLLDKYRELSIQRGVDERHIKGIELLKDRVLAWQRQTRKGKENQVRLPDVEPGKEEKRVCRANKC